MVCDTLVEGFPASGESGSIEAIKHDSSQHQTRDQPAQRGKYSNQSVVEKEEIAKHMKETPNTTYIFHS